MKNMQLTKETIEKAIALEEAWSGYLISTRSTEEAESGIDYQSGKWRDQLLKDEATQHCKGLKAFLRALSDAEFRELKVLMSIGRGEYPPTEFQDIYEQTSMAADREEDVSYMIEKMEVANYFRDGFEKLNTAKMI